MAQSNKNKTSVVSLPVTCDEVNYQHEHDTLIQDRITSLSFTIDLTNCDGDVPDDIGQK